MLRDVVNNHPGLLAAAGRTILTQFFRGRKKRAHLSVFAASLSSPKSFRVLTSHTVSTIRDAKFSSGNISPFTYFHCPRVALATLQSRPFTQAPVHGHAPLHAQAFFSLWRCHDTNPRATRRLALPRIASRLATFSWLQLTQRKLPLNKKNQSHLGFWSLWQTSMYAHVCVWISVCANLSITGRAANGCNQASLAC